MKKFAFIFAAIAASIVVSCTKETPAETPDTSAPAEMKLVTITASVDDTATKTTYTPDGTDPTLLKFSWTKGDQISVWCSDDKFHTLTAESDGASVNFSGMIPEGVYLGWYAFYPADVNHADCVFSIPQYKDISAQFSADLPMGAQVVDGVYQFAHMTGAALLTFTNFPTEVTTAEISIVNARLKLTGLFSSHLSSGLWTWNSQSDVEECERTFIRKVPVANAEAQLYMPYNGSLWWDYTSTINIKGYDVDGNEYILLKDQKMKADEASAIRGTVKPYAPLALPDYIPPVDWTKVDWEGENVISIEAEKVSGVKVIADKYYVYVQVSVPTATEWDRLYYGIAKGIGSQQPWWQWSTSAETAYYTNGTIVDGVLTVKYNGCNADTYSFIEGDITHWCMALPRDAHELTQSVGDIYFGIMTYLGSSTHTGTAPLRNQPMAVIPLP